MKVITGGQTGADRGALEAARRCGIPTGGWCPSGYRTENGEDVSLRSFGLRTMSGSYAARTNRNVQEADAVLVFMHKRSPGSVLTIRLAQQFRKPLCLVDPMEEGHRWLPMLSQVQDFLTPLLRIHRTNSLLPVVLLVGGNREAKSPGIQHRVQEILEEVFQREL